MIYNIKELSELVNITTGKLDANAMEVDGQYPFFTCAKTTYKINNFAFDSKAILLAGNNASGDFSVKYYEGKFNAYQRTYVITIENENEFDYTFLRHKLEGHLKVFKNQAIGANTRFLKIGMIKGIKIQLPPLTQQKKIANILDAADAYRQKTKALIAKYDELTQSLFLNMFGDPVRNPMGWERDLLLLVTSKIGSGATPRGGKETYKEEGISLIRSLNVYDNRFKYKNLAFIDSDQAYKLKNVIVEEDDVLFNITGASICRSTVVPKNVLPARVNQHVSILRPMKNIISSLFLSHLLISENVKMKLLGVGSGGGAVMEAITKVQLQNFDVIKPPIKLQNQFAERVQAIEFQKAQAQSSLKKAEDLFNSLLQKAFKGEL